LLTPSARFYLRDPYLAHLILLLSQRSLITCCCPICDCSSRFFLKSHSTSRPPAPLFDPVDLFALFHHPSQHGPPETGKAETRLKGESAQRSLPNSDSRRGLVGNALNFLSRTSSNTDPTPSSILALNAPFPPYDPTSPFGPTPSSSSKRRLLPELDEPASSQQAFLSFLASPLVYLAPLPWYVPPPLL
jgi:hypothetical protein